MCCKWLKALYCPDSGRFSFRFDISVALCVVISVGVALGDTAPELCTGLCDTLTLKTAVRFKVNRITRKP